MKIVLCLMAVFILQGCDTKAAKSRNDRIEECKVLRKEVVFDVFGKIQCKEKI
jgi:uncharacterized membrane protein YsdA (DUF1294 family)